MLARSLSRCGRILRRLSALPRRSGRGSDAACEWGAVPGRLRMPTTTMISTEAHGGWRRRSGCSWEQEEEVQRLRGW
eukprot:1723707-Rhodomonas_salina.1